MFMRHAALTKNMGPNRLTALVEKAMRDSGVRVIAGEDHWRLGESGGALVLCQVQGIDDHRSHVVTVAASVEERAAGVAQTVSSAIEQSVPID